MSALDELEALARSGVREGEEVHPIVWATDVLALVEQAKAEQRAGTTLTVPDSPKSLRETLCLAQSAVAHRGTDVGRRDRDVAVLGRLIDECDRHRPLGPDGKHDDRHTPTCGCEEA